MNAQELIQKYIQIRDKKDEIAKEQKAVMARINHALTKIEGMLMEQLEASGSESMKTHAGTCYRSIRSSVTVEDREVFLDYVRQHEAWDLLESRAAKKDVEAFLEEHEDIPPGLRIRRDAVINVRRPS